MKSLLFIFFCCLACNSYAQPDTTQAWTIEQLFTFARQNSVPLQQVQLQTQSADIQLRQSQQDRLPNLNGSGSYGVNVGRNIDAATNTFATEASQNAQLNLSSQVVIYQGGLRGLTIESRKTELELARLQVDEYAYNLELSVLGSYLQILLSQAQLEVLQSQATLTQEQYAQVQKLVKAGSVPGGNLLDIEAQIANDELNIINAQNAIRTAYLSLSRQLDYYGAFRVSTPELPEPTGSEIAAMNVEQLYQNALNAHPSVQTAATQSRLAEQQLNMARTGSYPIVSLAGNVSSRFSSLAQSVNISSELDTIVAPYVTQTGELIYTLAPIYTTSNAPFFEQWVDNLGAYVGLTVNVPIFNNYQVKNNVQLAQINMDNARFGEQAARNTIRQTIEQEYLNAQSAWERYRASQVNIEALEKNLDFVQKRYNLGLVTNLEFNTAKNNLATAQLNLEAAKYEYYFRLNILNLYQGQPVLFPAP